MKVKRFDIIDTNAKEHFKVKQFLQMEDAYAWCVQNEPDPTGLDQNWRYMIQPIFHGQK